MDQDLMKDIFMDLRRIMRAMDVYSRQLSGSHGLTGPQMLCLREIAGRGSLTTGALAKGIALSPATLTGILDRLEVRGLVSRERRPEDKRRVLVSLTPLGKQMSQELPSPLQMHFSARLTELPPDEQVAIRLALGSVARMMAELEVLPNGKNGKR
ncbi:MAG TPA: MarR family transcriptional regulator [Gammaproteobacteria bacterium]|nr:MarR family transcriptional regulator [Gammaproteobacteria bacterium]